MNLLHPGSIRTHRYPNIHKLMIAQIGSIARIDFGHGFPMSFLPLPLLYCSLQPYVLYLQLLYLLFQSAIVLFDITAKLALLLCARWGIPN